RDDLAHRAAAERVLLLDREHQQRQHVLLIRERQAHARVPVRGGDQSPQQRRLDRIRLVGRRRMQQLGQDRAAIGLAEKCTGMEELSHEARGQLIDRQPQVAAQEARSLALVEIHERIAADLVERERRAPIGPHVLQIAEELEHDGFGVARPGQPLGNIPQIEFRHGVVLPQAVNARWSRYAKAIRMPRGRANPPSATTSRAAGARGVTAGVRNTKRRRTPMPRLVSERPILGMSSELGEVMAQARAREAAGERVLHLERGEPDFDTPPHIVEALAAAARAGETHYPDVRGTPALRRALVEKLARENGIACEPDDVVVTVGGTHGLYCAFQALLGPAQEVLVLSPHWMAIPKLVAFCAGSAMRTLPAYL